MGWNSFTVLEGINFCWLQTTLYIKIFLSSTRPKIHLLLQSVSIPYLEHFLSNKYVERLPSYFEPRIWSRSQTIRSSDVRPATMIGSQSLINLFTATVNQGNLYQSSSTRSKAYHKSEVLSAPLRLGIYLFKKGDAKELGHEFETEANSYWAKQ